MPAGAPWWRVVRASSSKDALEYAKICYPSDMNNRFTPVYSAGAIVPAAYAGSTPETALWEVVLRGIRHDGIRRVPEHQTTDRYLVETRVIRPLKLLNVRRPNDANLVAHLRVAPSFGRLHRFIPTQETGNVRCSRRRSARQLRTSPHNSEERSQTSRRRRGLRPPSSTSPEETHGYVETMVSYTYKIKAAAPGCSVRMTGLPNAGSCMTKSLPEKARRL
jgi:RES domain